MAAKINIPNDPAFQLANEMQKEALDTVINAPTPRMVDMSPMPDIPPSIESKYLGDILDVLRNMQKDMSAIKDILNS